MGIKLFISSWHASLNSFSYFLWGIWSLLYFFSLVCVCVAGQEGGSLKSFLYFIRQTLQAGVVYPESLFTAQRDLALAELPPGAGRGGVALGAGRFQDRGWGGEGAFTGMDPSDPYSLFTFLLEGPCPIWEQQHSQGTAIR